MNAFATVGPVATTYATTYRATYHRAHTCRRCSTSSPKWFCEHRTTTDERRLDWTTTRMIPTRLLPPTRFPQRRDTHFPYHGHLWTPHLDWFVTPAGYCRADANRHRATAVAAPQDPNACAHITARYCAAAHRTSPGRWFQPTVLKDIHDDVRTVVTDTLVSPFLVQPFTDMLDGNSSFLPLLGLDGLLPYSACSHLPTYATFSSPYQQTP